jgi:hypothetical protein
MMANICTKYKKYINIAQGEASERRGWKEGFRKKGNLCFQCQRGVFFLVMITG